MNVSDKIQFPYNILRLWLDSIIKLFVIIGITVSLFLIEKQPFGIIIGILFILIFTKHTIKAIKNLYRSLLKYPAVELTEECFIDHLNDKKIYWQNIKKINIALRRDGNTYLNFDLKNRENYIRQVNNPIEKFFFKIAPDVGYIQTNISFVKGNNYDIYEQVNSLYNRKIRN